MSKNRFARILAVTTLVSLIALAAFLPPTTQAMSGVWQEASRAEDSSAMEVRGEVEARAADAAPDLYWEARLVSETADYSLSGSVLRVLVIRVWTAWAPSKPSPAPAPPQIVS